MPSSPNQPHTGKQFELRVAASDLEFDKKLSRLTLPTTRALLPGYLYLYSEQLFHLDIKDRDIDGHSFTETQFRGLQMRVTNHNRNKYSLETNTEKARQPIGDKELRVRVGLQLGIQGASEIMISPFFTPEERAQGTIPFYYTVPDPVQTRTMGVAFTELQEFLVEKPRGIVDELMLVETALRTRAIRQRQRPENPVTAPINLVVSDVDTSEQGRNLREVS